MIRFLRVAPVVRAMRASALLQPIAGLTANRRALFWAIEEGTDGTSMIMIKEGAKRPMSIYATLWSIELLRRLEEAVRSGPRVIAEFLDSGGQSQVFTEDDF
jgi:hypothetical protein